MVQVNPAHNEFFQQHGYVVVSGLFGRAETASYIDHFMRLRETAGGGPCGVWVDHDGRNLIEVTGTAPAHVAAHE